jgi:hypothetical protein
LLGSAFGWPAFFCGLRLSAPLRLFACRASFASFFFVSVSGCAATTVVFSASPVMFDMLVFSFDAPCRHHTIHYFGSEEPQGKSVVIRQNGAHGGGLRAIGGVDSFLIKADKKAPANEVGLWSTMGESDFQPCVSRSRSVSFA